MNTDALIGVAVLTLAGTTFVAEVRAGHGPEFHTFIGAAFVGVFLAILAAINDALGAAFAMFVIAVAVLHNGAATFDAVNGGTK